MNCLECHNHSLVLTCMYGFAKTELTCWGLEVKGGKPIPYNPGEDGIHVVTAPDWCPLARCQKPGEVTK